MEERYYTASCEAPGIGLQVGPNRPLKMSCRRSSALSSSGRRLRRNCLSGVLKASQMASVEIGRSCSCLAHRAFCWVYLLPLFFSDLLFKQSVFLPTRQKRKHIMTRGKPKDTGIPARIARRAACELCKSHVRERSTWMGDEASPCGVRCASNPARLVPGLHWSSSQIAAPGDPRAYRRRSPRRCQKHCPVLRPTPGSVTRSSIVCGTSPP